LESSLVWLVEAHKGERVGNRAGERRGRRGGIGRWERKGGKWKRALLCSVHQWHKV
jgi:hypothetical protein